MGAFLKKLLQNLTPKQVKEIALNCNFDSKTSGKPTFRLFICEQSKWIDILPKLCYNISSVIIREKNFYEQLMDSYRGTP